MKYFITLTLILMTVMTNQVMASIGSAVVSLSPSTTTINHPQSISLALFNTVGASQLTVTNVVITATSTSNPSSSRLPYALSVFNQQAPNAVPITLAAGATTTANVGNIIFFSPSTGITGSGTGTYSVGATIYTSDGAITAAATSGVATINPIPLPAYERQ